MSQSAAVVRPQAPSRLELARSRARLGVVPRRIVPASRTPFVVLVVCLLVGGVVTLLLFNTSLQQASFLESSLRDRAASLAAEEQLLRMDLEERRDPQQLAEVAKSQGMVQSGSPQFVRLDGDEALGTATPAVPGTGVRLREKAPAKPKVLRPQQIKVAAGAARED